jgi:hypothetical protein
MHVKDAHNQASRNAQGFKDKYDLAPSQAKNQLTSDGDVYDVVWCGKDTSRNNVRIGKDISRWWLMWLNDQGLQQG